MSHTYRLRYEVEALVSAEAIDKAEAMLRADVRVVSVEVMEIAPGLWAVVLAVWED